MALVLPRTRLNAGLRTTGSVDVTGAAQPDSNYVITIGLDAADLADATLTIPYALLLDGTEAQSGQWIGGQTDRAGNPLPFVIQAGTSGTPPATAELQITLPRRTFISVDITRGRLVQAKAG